MKNYFFNKKIMIFLAIRFQFIKKKKKPKISRFKKI
jgi:hypothetical protein